jgi:replicative DNA helicase
MDDKDSQDFGPVVEAAIISLCLDQPEFYHAVGQHVEPKHFEQLETQYVFALIQKAYKEHEIVPNRDILIDIARKDLSVDDHYQPVLNLITRESDPREIPIIKDRLIDWVRSRAYALLYDEGAIQAYESGNYDVLNEIVEKAQRVSDVSQQGVWFFDRIEMLFKEDAEPRFTTGFTRLDRYLNEGGPTRGDVTCFMAPTGVGKSIMLVNVGVANIRNGKNVLHITLELSTFKTMLRYMGAFTKKHLVDRMEQQGSIREELLKIKHSVDSRLVIYEFPPDDISVNTIYQIVDWLHKYKRWIPDVILVDYLDLMLSRREYNNKEDYVRQKRISTEIRGLAKNTGTCVFTATQTHRQAESDSYRNKKSSADQNIGLSKIAESYGKAMPLDYIISMNQSGEMYSAGQIRLYVIKNRNGPKFKTINTNVNYANMKMEQAKFESLTVEDTGDSNEV